MSTEKSGSLFDRPEVILVSFIFAAMVAWTLQHALLQRVFAIDIYETIVWGEEFQLGADID